MSSPSITIHIGANEDPYLHKYDDDFPIVGLGVELSVYIDRKTAHTQGDALVEKAAEIADVFAQWADAVRVEHTRRQQARIAQADAEATYSGNLSAAAIADHQTKALRLIAGAVSS